jgi:hypothetical protein
MSVSAAQVNLALWQVPVALEGLAWLVVNICWCIHVMIVKRVLVHAEGQLPGWPCDMKQSQA